MLRESQTQVTFREGPKIDYSQFPRPNSYDSGWRYIEKEGRWVNDYADDRPPIQVALEGIIRSLLIPAISIIDDIRVWTKIQKVFDSLRIRAMMVMPDFPEQNNPVKDNIHIPRT